MQAVSSGIGYGLKYQVNFPILIIHPHSPLINPIITIPFNHCFDCLG